MKYLSVPRSTSTPLLRSVLLLLCTCGLIAGVILITNTIENTSAQSSHPAVLINPLGGNVGIGITNPTEKLDVAGNIQASGTICDSTGCIGSVDGDNLGNHTATQNLQLNGNWLSNDGGSEGVFVDTEGKVGIGQAAPNAELEVSGNIIAASPTANNHVATKEYVDNIAAGSSIIQSIQRGKVTDLGGFAGTVDVTINAVDLTKSFFVVNGGNESSGQHSTTTAYGELLSPTLLRMRYNSGSGGDHTVIWQVIEYK